MTTPDDTDEFDTLDPTVQDDLAPTDGDWRESLLLFVMAVAAVMTVNYIRSRL